MEIRVHGIGTHNASEVLGQPLVDQGDEEIGEFRRAAISRPDARAFVWSRTTRSGFRSYRYLLLPFTLINVAGFMHVARRGDDASRGEWDYRILVHLVGASVTVSYLFWLLALAVDFPHIHIRKASENYLIFAAIAVGLIVLGPIIFQALFPMRRVSSAPDPSKLGRVGQDSFWAPRASRSHYLLHFVSVASLICLVLGVRELGFDKLVSLFLIQWALLLVLGLRWASKFVDGRPEVGGFFALGLAVGLPHLCFGSLSIMLGNLFDWLSIPHSEVRIGTLVFSADGHWQYLPTLVFFSLALWGWLAYRGLQSIRVSEQDIEAARKAYNVDPSESLPDWFIRILHMRTKPFIQNTPGNLLPKPVHLMFGVILFAAFELFWFLSNSPHQRPASGTFPGNLYEFANGFFSRTAQYLNLYYLSLFVVMVIGIAVWLIASSSNAREKTAILFDVLGYWPQRHHPLAPQPYADRVTQMLADLVSKYALDRVPVSVIAHSQGSVLAFTALCRAKPEIRQRVDLITCGSPLHSLYATSFPAYFNEAYFHALRGGVRSWNNLYRDTDPIGTPIFGATDVSSDKEILEPAPAQIVQGHSGYWDDPQMCAVLDVAPRKDEELASN